MKMLLICHQDASLDREGLARWLASFAELVGVIELREGGGKFFARVRRELKRSGWLRFLDVVAFRVCYKIFLARRDRAEEARTLEKLRRDFPPLRADLPVLVTDSPNSAEAESFIRSLQPDAAIARCKVLLKRKIFSLPRLGTFVLHPGICPEYRNAHGCFWALAQNDDANVGLTLLRVDDGVDTGPVFGHFRCAFDAAVDSHIAIQSRVVFENLGALREKFLAIASGAAQPVAVAGRSSNVWGQPWLTKFLAWRGRARKQKGKA
jgi:hypothetical protein